MRGHAGTLHDSEYALGVLEKADIVCLTEAGAHAPVIPDFTLVEHAVRGRASHCGGVAVLLRSSLYAAWRPRVLHSSGENGIVCVSVKPVGCRPVHLACCYLPHGASNVLGRSPPARKEAVQALYETLTDLRIRAGGADFVITGDLNARTSCVDEIQLQDCGDDTTPHMLDFAQAMHLVGPRASQDSNVDTSGRALLEFCAHNSLAIMNGRLQGDDEGSFTFRTTYGNPPQERKSLVDYCIAPVALCFDTATGTQRAGCSLSVDHAAFTANVMSTNVCFDHAPLLFSFAAREAPALPPPEPRVRSKRVRWDPEKQGAYARQLTHNPALSNVLQCQVGSHASHMLVTAAFEAAESAGLVSQPGLGPGGRRPRKQVWFDLSCVELRKAMRDAVLAFGIDSQTAKAATNKYRAHVRNIKQAYQEKELKARVHDWARSPAAFWRDFKSQHGNKVFLGVGHWTAHFKSVMGRKQDNTVPVETHCEAHPDLFPRPTAMDIGQAVELNSDISRYEVAEALKRLSNQKSAGVDAVPAELLTHDLPPNIEGAVHALLPQITHVFNLVLKGVYPAEWATCSLTPVPKGKGDPNNASNYRGIAVSAAIAKLFSLVLLKRLDKWAEATGRRAAGQAGFRSGRSTVDGVFVLQHCIEACRERKKELYVAFIDFEKAYDSINRDLLWKVIEGMGVHGTMLKCLKGMHAAIMLRVKEGGVLGEPFRAELGVKQGDPLSPLLFGLFIDRLEKYLLQQCPGVGLEVAQALLQSLLYADDLALASCKAEDLRQLLGALERFSDINHLTVNLSKCKCVVFNVPGGRGARKVLDERFMYKGSVIEPASSFVYLGTTFYSNCRDRLRDEKTCHIQRNITIRLSKAKAAYVAMRQRCAELNIHNVALRCNLFNALVSSVLASGSEVWGVYVLRGLLTGQMHWGQDGEVEAFHRMFLRWAFGMLPKSVSSLVLLLESGRSPLVHGWLKQMLSWYNRVICRPAHDLVHRCLVESLTLGKSWGSDFLFVLAGIDSECARTASGFEKVGVGSVMCGLQKCWEASWPCIDEYRSISVRQVTVSEDFKFITYCKRFRPSEEGKKLSFGYHLLKPLEVRTMAAFRMSAHKLRIETGRHGRREHRHDRVCTFCDSGQVEDELHVLECTAYHGLRLLFGLPNEPDPSDARLRELFNPGKSSAVWKQRAAFLIHLFAQRDN